MIIGSDIKLEVGRVYGPETHKSKILSIRGEQVKEFRFMVMRESNEQEYRDYFYSQYGNYPNNWIFSIFYEISPD